MKHITVDRWWNVEGTPKVEVTYAQGDPVLSLTMNSHSVDLPRALFEEICDIRYRIKWPEPEEEEEKGNE